MSNPTHPLQPAIEALEKDALALERQWNELVSAINVLRSKAGLPPRPGSGMPRGSDVNAGATEVEGSGAAPVQVRSDTFYGKRMGTAVREYMEMRRASGQGAAKTREIFDGLKAGGFVFETKDDSVAMISLRNMMRKRSEIFQRVPNGAYGLKAWYPHAKQPKGSLAPEGAGRMLRSRRSASCAGLRRTARLVSRGVV